MTQMARNEVVFYITKCKKKVTEPQVYLIKQKIKQKGQKLYMCRKCLEDSRMVYIKLLFPGDERSFHV